MLAIETTTVSLPFSSPPSPADVEVRWFGPYACVVQEDETASVYVGGVLVGRYERGAPGPRNALLVQLAKDPRAHLGQLAAAFGITAETLRLIRRQEETDGMAAVVARRQGGARPKLTGPARRRLEAMFADGLSPGRALAKLGRRAPVRLRTVEALWNTLRSAVATGAGAVTSSAEASGSALVLPGVLESDTSVSGNGGAASHRPAPRNEAEHVQTGAPTTRGVVHGGEVVQHVGTWLLLSMLEAHGLYAMVAKHGDKADLDRDQARLAVDAFAVALALGEGSVEGVRRLATPSGGRLLRSAGVPSPPWVRSTLGELADAGGLLFHLGVASRFLHAAKDEAVDDRVVFYVDNHLRPYTGKHVVRRGWRMQDKRVRPGASDYYVHDEDGRPLFRFDAPAHDSLPEWLGPIVRTLRLALGKDLRMLLAFDRAGAYPKTMTALRDDGVEFVTYERRPYRQLLRSAFEKSVVLDGETLRYQDAAANLGGGRGRVRRVAVLMPDDRQVNLMAVSGASAERLIGVMRGRWNQENGFKHGVERWGINQLDARKVEAYPPETIVPNPARRRLDHALRVAQIREGDLRVKLAELAEAGPRREKLEADLADALARRRQLLEERPRVPVRAPLEETELAGKLVRHRGDYKLVLDAIRIACANAEADLAMLLAPHLYHPAEAKKTLANLFAAPGCVHTTPRTATVQLLPAGNVSERRAFNAALQEINGWKLRLPGDPDRRRLRFEAQS